MKASCAEPGAIHDRPRVSNRGILQPSTGEPIRSVATQTADATVVAWLVSPRCRRRSGRHQWSRSRCAARMPSCHCCRCASVSNRFGAIEDGLLLPHDDQAIALFCELLGRSHPIGLSQSPIGIMEAMAAGEGPIYCPLIFGYMSHASRPPHPVFFGNAPRASMLSVPRFVLGGPALPSADAARVMWARWRISPGCCRLTLRRPWSPATTASPAPKQPGFRQA